MKALRCPVVSSAERACRAVGLSIVFHGTLCSAGGGSLSSHRHYHDHRLDILVLDVLGELKNDTNKGNIPPRST